MSTHIVLPGVAKSGFYGLGCRGTSWNFSKSVRSSVKLARKMACCHPFRMTWQPFSGMAALIECKEGFLLDIDGDSVGPTAETVGLGYICFAYGLDNSPLFHTSNCPPFSQRWAVWHFSAVVCNNQGDEDLPRFIERGQEEAQKLMPPARFADIKVRFDARLRLVQQHEAASKT